jgi:hypothetical protein
MKPKVMKSNDYYVGTEVNGMPHCRISGYYKTRMDALVGLAMKEFERRPESCTDCPYLEGK